MPLKPGSRRESDLKRVTVPTAHSGFPPTSQADTHAALAAQTQRYWNERSGERPHRFSSTPSPILGHSVDVVARATTVLFPKRNSGTQNLFRDDDEDKVRPFCKLNVKQPRICKHHLNAGFASNLSSRSGMYNFIQKLQTSESRILNNFQMSAAPGEAGEQSGIYGHGPSFLRAVYAATRRPNLNGAV